MPRLPSPQKPWPSATARSGSYSRVRRSACPSFSRWRGQPRHQRVGLTRLERLHRGRPPVHLAARLAAVRMQRAPPQHCPAPRAHASKADVLTHGTGRPQPAHGPRVPQPATRCLQLPDRFCVALKRAYPDVGEAPTPQLRPGRLRLWKECPLRDQQGAHCRGPGPAPGAHSDGRLRSMQR